MKRQLVNKKNVYKISSDVLIHWAMLPIINLIP